ncbi:hypothetical protein EVB87_209 [Rhizobium phage RHph_N28_1]|nr:hypothetical protein EVB87_209 [Rhizobium phage RHph_N28_1]QIG74238.1 hypothetical protein EVC07_210 [Rhizobium phage RHph_N42]
MGQETIGKMTHPYICKLSGATFQHPCSVTTCPAHVSNLNQSGVKVEPVTNCAHADFSLAGYAEPLDYAVEEQGFVGIRDLAYMSTFMKVSPTTLRDLYTNNVELLRRAIALHWALANKSTHPHCDRCGRPNKSGIRCLSVSMCSDRETAVSEVVKPLLPSLLQPSDMISAYNVIWRSLTEKFLPEISLTPTEREVLDDLL